MNSKDTYEPAASSLTYVVADDHSIVRDAIVAMVQQAQASMPAQIMECVATAANGLEAIAAVKQHRPDLLFLDISMPLASGVEVLNDLRRWSPDTRILVFTGVVSPGLLSEAVAAGVDALLSKRAETAEVTAALQVVLRGGRHIAPEFVEILEQADQAATLTDRERQTLNMIVSGKSSKEIASLMNISPKTVDKHRSSLMQKLDVHSIAQLMQRALRDGLIDPQ